MANNVPYWHIVSLKSDFLEILLNIKFNMLINSALNYILINVNV